MKKTILNLLKALIIPVAVYLIFLILSFDRFGTFNTFYAILAQSVVPAILGFGVAYSFLSGVLDFTVGSRIIVASVVGALCAQYFGIAGLVIGCIITAVVLGLIVALVDRALKIPSLILTLGLAMIFEIVGYELKLKTDFNYLDKQYTLLGRPYITLIIFIFVAVLFYFLFNRLKITYHLRATGGDPVHAKDIGINLDRSKLLGFAIGSIFLGISAVLSLSYTGTVTALTGLSSAMVLFKPLMGLLIGMVLGVWVNLALGIFIGTLTVNIIFIGLLAAGLPDTFQDVALGFFMLLIMWFSSKRPEIIKVIGKIFKKKEAEESII